MTWRRTCLAAGALLVCLGLVLDRPVAAQDEAVPRPVDLGTLKKQILEAKDLAETTIPALDILSHPDRKNAGDLVDELLRGKGTPAIALLKAMAARNIAWSDVVPGVLVILGDGSPELADAAEKLVRQEWLRPGSRSGEACLAQVERRLRAPRRENLAELRGGVQLARMLKRVEDIRPLIGLLERDLDRETRMRVADALEEITQDPRFGTDAARWRQWAEGMLEEGMTRERLLEKNGRAVFKETSEMLIRELKSTVTALGEKEIERLGWFLATPHPNVTVEAALQLGALYSGMTDEEERKRVQAKALPMLIRLLDHHKELVVEGGLGAVGKLAKPELGDQPIARELRERLSVLGKEGTDRMQILAVRALVDFADVKDVETARRLQTLLEGADAKAAGFRVALINALGAFRQAESVPLLRRLTEKEANDEVRFAAATVYLQVAPDEAIQALSDILARGDTTEMVRRRFASELGNVITKHPNVIGALEAQLERDTDEKVLVICAENLGYAQGKENVARAGAALHQRLKRTSGGAEPRLAAAIATSLGELGHVAAVSDLIPLARLGRPELNGRVGDALVKIAISDVKRALSICAQLLGDGMYGTVVTAYQALSKDAARAKLLNEQPREYRTELNIVYIRALMASEDSKSLEVALAELEALRRTQPDDAELMLLEARILHESGAAMAEKLAEFLSSNRPPNNDKKVQREWNVLGAWVQVRLKKKDAASLFKNLYNGEVGAADSLYWEYLVGYALALLQQDPKDNRDRIGELLGKLPQDAFEKKAPRWLKAEVEGIRKALAPPPAAEEPPAKEEDKPAGESKPVTDTAAPVN
ncbi:MAG: HEAT repeat domain-containing protein [Planctomycetes bacterium]|nr:HEAT repeat domain-containing protein [Planctomycetota bacterium]